MGTSLEIQLIHLMAGPWISQSIYVFVKLGMVTQLQRGPKSAQELANGIGANNEAVARILAGLVKISIVQLESGGRYRLTSLGQCLSPSAPGGCHAFALLWGEEFATSWSYALEAVRSGKTGFELANGCDLFSYLGRNGSAAANFNAAMGGFSKLIYPAAARLLKGDMPRRIVDVGGGTGALLNALLDLEPASTGILYDRPEVVAAALPHLEAVTNSGRCTAVGGDFFSGPLPEGDLYVLANIIHDWDDAAAVNILQNCRAAMGQHGQLALFEMLLDGQGEPELARMTDLNMMMLTGGRERTQSELTILLKKAGFEVTAVRTAEQMTCLVEATPIAVEKTSRAA